MIEMTYNELETEVCDVTKPVHFQWVAVWIYPHYALQSKYPPAPMEKNTLEVKLLGI